LFDPPTDPAAIIRHYTLSAEDLALIRLGPSEFPLLMGASI
jgi:hypothetical protein